MRHLIVIPLLVVLPAIAHADIGGFVQGIVGYSSPIAGEQYTRGVDSGAARVGVRAGWAPIQIGRVRLGVEVGVDWRALDVEDDETAQHVRALVGPRVMFVADRYAVIFRATVGYDHLALGYEVNDTGYALEPGFGATYRHDTLLFGAEVAVPVLWHPQETGDDLDGFAGADLQMMLSVGAEL